MTESKAPYPGWHDFVAGAVAGAGARVLTHPLDLIRIRRQLAATWTSHHSPTASTTIWQDFVGVVQNEGGIRGLFRGTVAGLNLWVSYTAVQFYAYGFTKKYFETSVFPDNNSPTLVAFCSGASAGVTATVTTYPLDLCRTIFAAKGASSAIATGGGVETSSSSKAPKNTREFATYLYQRRGWRGFYAGCAPTVVQVVPYLGCSFAIYDGLTRGDRNVGLSAYAGSIAGATSKTLVYPMDTVKKRMQSQAFFGNPQQQRQYASILDCVTTIYRVEGPSAFYNGLVPSVLKTALAAGFSFAFFRSTKNLLESIHDRPFTEEDPPTRRAITRRLTTGH